MYGLDLFSGIGGITKALEGYVRPIAYCENDRYAQAVLLSRMAHGDIPEAPIWDDVRTLMGSMLPLSPSIIYGGFPCQDISNAGRGAGLAGKRSGLFFEIVRLISDIRPQFVFLENVSAIRVRGGDVVAGELARLGYDCRWDMLSAQDVGANHERERWWLLAHARCVCRRDIQPSERGQDAQGQRCGYHHATSGPGEQPALLAHTAGARPGRIRSGDAARLSRARSSGANVADAESERTYGSQSTGELNAKRICEEMADSTSQISHGLPIREAQAYPKPRQSGWWAVEPAVGRVAHGIPFRVDQLRALGNAVVPAQAREAFERLMGIK